MTFSGQRWGHRVGWNDLECFAVHFEIEGEYYCYCCYIIHVLLLACNHTDEDEICHYHYTFSITSQRETIICILRIAPIPLTILRI